MPRIKHTLSPGSSSSFSKVYHSLHTPAPGSNSWFSPYGLLQIPQCLSPPQTLWIPQNLPTLYSPVIHEIEQTNQTKISGEYIGVRQLCSDALWSVALPSAWQAPPLSKVGLAPTRSGVQNPTPGLLLARGFIDIDWSTESEEHTVSSVFPHLFPNIGPEI